MKEYGPHTYLIFKSPDPNREGEMCFASADLYPDSPVMTTSGEVNELGLFLHASMPDENPLYQIIKFGHEGFIVDDNVLQAIKDLGYDPESLTNEEFTDFWKGISGHFVF